MTKKEFEQSLKEHAATIEEIRQTAWDLHRSVGQTYGKTLPYGHHLDMVVDDIRRFGYLVAVEENDVLPLVFGGYYHDSIEDARQTYNDVMKAARRWMSDEQALVATEIVYALTNDKGRSREERAGERYYAGIRETPFAPFVKLCDRFANVAHSCRSKDANNQRMKGIYSKEMPHFLSNIVPPSDDPRRQVPQVVVDEMMGLLQNG
jgi:hypothetical protein